MMTMTKVDGIVAVLDVVELMVSVFRHEGEKEDKSGEASLSTWILFNAKRTVPITDPKLGPDSGDAALRTTAASQ